MYKDIVGNGWKAREVGIETTLFSYIQNLSSYQNSYFVTGNMLYKIDNHNIMQFGYRIDRTKIQNNFIVDWVIVSLPLNSKIQPVFALAVGVEEKPLNEKPLIDFGKDLETTSSLPARLLTSEFHEQTGEYKFLCLIKKPAASHDLIRSFNKFGECNVHSDFQLRNCPKKISLRRWVNIHRNGAVRAWSSENMAINEKTLDDIVIAFPITIDTVEGFDPRKIV